MVANTENKGEAWRKFLEKNTAGLVTPDMIEKRGLPIASTLLATQFKDTNLKRVTIGASHYDTAEELYNRIKGHLKTDPKSRNYADLGMDILSGGMLAGAAISGDTDAALTVDLMEMMRDLSHEQEEGIDKKFQQTMKVNAKTIAGLPMLAHVREEASHEHGADDDHKHPPIYGDAEKLEKDAGITLLAHEQKALAEMLDHWRMVRDKICTKKEIDTGTATALKAVEHFYEDWEKLENKENRTNFEVQSFLQKYGFMITHIEGKENEFKFHTKEGEPKPYTKDWWIKEEDVPKGPADMPKLTILGDGGKGEARTFEGFKNKFSCLIYEVKRSKQQKGPEEVYTTQKGEEKKRSTLIPKKDEKGNIEYENEEFLPSFAREIRNGDLVKVPAGRGVPADGVLTEGNTEVDASAHSGEGTANLKKGDVITQRDWNMGNDVTIRATAHYKESSGFMFLHGDTSDKEYRADKQLKLKKQIEQYFKWMLAGGTMYFLSDAVKNGKEGHYFDPKTLFGKDNIRKTFEFFVSAAPCPLAASMLVYKGIENRLRDDHGVRVMNRNQFASAMDVDTVVFDMTGTLTEGAKGVAEFKALEGANARELIAIAKGLEQGQTHPVAHAIRHYKDEISPLDIDGLGKYKDEPAPCGKYTGKNVYVGNAKLFELLVKDKKVSSQDWRAMQKAQNQFVRDNSNALCDATFVWKQKNGTSGEWAMFGTKEELRKEAKATIDSFLKQDGIKRVIIATGATPQKAEAVMNKMFSKEELENKKLKVYNELKEGLMNVKDTAKRYEEYMLASDISSEDDKIESMRKFYTNYKMRFSKTDLLYSLIQDDKAKIMMVGDNANDAPALHLVAESEGGISVGMDSQNSGRISGMVGVFVNKIDESYRIYELSKKLDKKVNENVNWSKGWMAFLVVLHLMGDTIKKVFGFEINTLIKGALHEGSTAFFAMKGGLWDSQKLSDFYRSMDKLFSPDKAQEPPVKGASLG